MTKLVFADETYKILGACFEVYKTMGCGFLEQVYQECLGIEFVLQKIAFSAQKELALKYKGRCLKQTYNRPDFICFEKLVLEIKAISNLGDEHRAQLINYLHSTGTKLGLLINFGHHPKLEHERFII